MHVVWNTLWLPKDGNSEAEYEDAFSLDSSGQSDCANFRCAIADGASETSFSKLWAGLLVEEYVTGAQREVSKLRWRENVVTMELPWYAEQKVEAGAFAALLGLSITDGTEAEQASWNAEAVGDCCMIQVRDDKIINRFPLIESEQFNNSPALICSIGAGNDDGSELIRTTGNWQSGDIFYLMTDALARWTYKRDEEHADACYWLHGLQDQSAISEFVQVQRHLLDADGRAWLRNDDVTLIAVHL